MKAAVVWEAGKSPVYSDFEEPIPHEGEVRVHVTASALTNFTKIRATGKHFSFSARPPFVVGIDGVGKLEDGRRVYFLFPRAPFGGIAERTVVSSLHCIDVPDSVDDITLAAIADPGMAAWAALETRAKMIAGETVLINGATGSAGRMAVQIAKFLGAKKVVATGRNREVLNSLLAIGADEVISQDHDGKSSDDELREQFAQRIDVVLDYLWGASAVQILAAATAAKGTTPIRFVQIGTTSAPEITLPGAVLRSSAIQMMGSGIGSVALEEIILILSKLMHASSEVGLHVATRELEISRIGEAWSAESATPRIVLSMNAP
ncbi:Quinone oxidoreductase [Acidisarcina polymorpha]|uniref:Quinone oxidoreductase n=1 Tax=Acidisarcina polymorpha TaxID=2211140 RepID=A0A2Z5FU72_9BACT|nr:zinc-binding alcohol dehydrogenase family protein [Acidisarcina polymorpha]AXC10047.1 Quinone oxidoreductase [Acidisarcina polymorpha]